MKQEESNQEKIDSLEAANDYSNPMTDLTNYITPRQVERLEQYILNDKVRSKKFTQKDLLLIYMLFRTGRRISEILQVKMSDIDFDNNMILWNILKKRAKKNKQRFKKGESKYVKREKKLWQPANLELMQLIIRFAIANKLTHNDYLFKSSSKYILDEVTGKKEHLPHTRQWAFMRIRDLTEKAGLRFKENTERKTPKRMQRVVKGEVQQMKKGWHPHHFRHGFAINFVNKSNNSSSLSFLQRALDHSSLKVTETYLQFSDKEMAKQYQEVFRDE